MNLIKDKGVKYITFGWLGFIAENIVVSHNREYIISHLGGEKSYKYLYSFCSSMATISIFYGYFKYARNKGPLIFSKLSNK